MTSKNQHIKISELTDEELECVKQFEQQLLDMGLTQIRYNWNTPREYNSIEIWANENMTEIETKIKNCCIN